MSVTGKWDGLPQELQALRNHFRVAGAEDVEIPAPHSDSGHRWSEESLRACFDQIGKTGLFRLAIPEEYGGYGANFQQMTAALEGFGHGCRDVGLGFCVADQFFSVADCILTFGNEEQKSRWLPPLSQGRVIGAQALTEPESGSDVMQMVTTAKPVKEGYEISGQKALIGLAAISDMTIVFATTDPAKGRWGTSAFLVAREDTGFNPSKSKPTLGLSASKLCDISLENCIVDRRRLLGKEGSGWMIVQRGLQLERSLIMATQVGAMSRQLSEGTAFARGRASGEGAIIKHQSVSNRLADMAVRLETCQLLLRKGAELADRGDNLAKHSAMTKLHISESFAASSLDAIRIMGGRGYLVENEVERDLRDSVGSLIYAGTSDIQRQIIANLLD